MGGGCLAGSHAKTNHTPRNSQKKKASIAKTTVAATPSTSVNTCNAERQLL